VDEMIYIKWHDILMMVIGFSDSIKQASKQEQGSIYYPVLLIGSF